MVKKSKTKTMKCGFCNTTILREELRKTPLERILNDKYAICCPNCNAILGITF